MFGIYIHIPYCYSKCGYCDFYSIIRLTDKNDFIVALTAEINQRCKEINDLPTSIYFGGGTPSMLSLDDFKRIFDSLRTHFDFSAVKEITVEVNPDDVTLSFIEGLAKLGVNRISMGIQSFNNRLLKFMNRRHNNVQAVNAVKNIKDAGISNISIDLIYGIPGMQQSEWVDSIEQAIALNVPHISAYHLTFEPNTPFYKRLQNQEIQEINDEDSVTQYQTLVDVLKQNGYIDYEISNFCKPNFESKHNSNYWTGNSYLGLGPSAHSYHKNVRRWNISDLTTYITKIESNEPIFENESLSENDVYNETIMLSLRTKRGLNLEAFTGQYSQKYQDYFNDILKCKLSSKEVIIQNGFLSVTDKSKFLTDKIISDFFFVES